VQKIFFSGLEMSAKPEDTFLLRTKIVQKYTIMKKEKCILYYIRCIWSADGCSALWLFWSRVSYLLIHSQCERQCCKFSASTVHKGRQHSSN